MKKDLSSTSMLCAVRLLKNQNSEPSGNLVYDAVGILPETKRFLFLQNSDYSFLFPPFLKFARANHNGQALVLARMDSNNKQTDEKRPVNSASKVSFCQRNKSGNGSFVSNLRNHFHEFIHASADEHKTCLRNTIQKIFNASKFLGKSGDSTNEVVPPTNMAMLFQRSGVSLSYMANAFSNSLFFSVVHLRLVLGEESVLDVIATKTRGFQMRRKRKSCGKLDTN
ncbi:hypothetical protein CR513_17907, partial [Mucuna pruriens]